MMNNKDIFPEEQVSSENENAACPSYDEMSEENFGDEYTVTDRLFDVLLVLSAFVFMISGICVSLTRYIPELAEWFCMNVSSAVRYALGNLSSLLPISIMEAAVFCTAVFAFAGIFVLVYRFITRDGTPPCLNGIKAFICIVLAANTLSNLGYAPLFSRKPVNEYIGIERREISIAELTDAFRSITDMLNEAVMAETEGVVFDGEGFSVMPYSFDELGEKVNAAYAKLTSDESFSFLTDMDVSAKPLLVSKYMTYTHLSGVYTAATGEANINTNYPDYVVAFSYAHELAHQRGVAPEDEASFVGYLALRNSDDSYLRYSALRYMWDYLRNALYSADRETYVDILRNDTHRSILEEAIAYGEFFEKYTDNAASQIADAVNDTSLKMNGEEAGTRSYGMVVDLVVLEMLSGD